MFPTKSKICRGCEDEVSIENFNLSRNTKDGYEGKCKTCRQEARKKYVRHCDMCGDEFRTARKNVTRCSQACVGKLRTRTHTREVPCVACGKTITLTLSAILENNYCDGNCYGIALAKRMSGERVSRVTIKCDHCGRTLLRREKEIEGIVNHFCDRKCFSKGIGKFRRDPNLTEEERLLKRNYPEYTEWRKEVLERDSYQCRACYNESKTMHVHHIINYSSCRELRTEKSNGIVLCERCHTEFHTVYGFSNNTDNQLKEYLIISNFESDKY